MSLTTRTLRLTIALAAALSLTATAACELRLTSKGGPSPAATSPQAATPAPTQGTAADAPDGNTPSGGPGGVSLAPPSAQSPAQGDAPRAEAPGASDASCPWLAHEAEDHSPVTASGPHYILNQNHEDIWIQNDLEQLTVLSTNNEVALNKVDHIVVSGHNATIYVCNVKTITIEARAGNTDIYWGGTTPPVVNNQGTNTDVEPYGK